MLNILIDDWRYVLRNAWSLRVALFWICIYALMMIWPVFIGTISVWVWAPLGFIMPVSYGIARLLKQPGTGDD